MAALVVLGFLPGAIADPVPRNSAPAGSVIARKIGEEIRFNDLANWSPVELRQDLLPGDILRTNATGQLALLFSDRTQVRLGRNATLLVKQIGAEAPTILDLQAGSIWARAQRGGVSLTIEAPAASAAIRGTDWTMTVDGDGKTSIIVLEGLVEFSNEFGSVSVGAGEAAVAEIGQAPVRVVIVDPKDREQMLYYLSVGGAFGWMPASPLATPQMRRERDRVAAIPEDQRSTEDWLVLAEAAQTYDGRAKAQAILDTVRRRHLTSAQRSRILLMDALNAGAERRYADAAGLFEKAAPGLDRKRRAIARYGAYFAGALADPNRHQPRPSPAGGGAYAVLAEAWTVGFLKDIKSAIEIIRRNETRFPDEPSLPAFRAQLALLLDDREQVEEAIAKALALVPDDPTALEARANYRSGIKGDLTGALGDLEIAVAAAPGSTTIWNAIGLVQGARGATLEAEHALRRAIELDPQDPVSYANLAILYLDQDRLKEAKVNIDRALELDPSFDVALIARGRYYLQAGDTDAAIGDLLAGTTASPAYSQGLLLLAAGHYAEKDGTAARQALENADRIDPNDPVTKIIEASVAIDDYEADKAISAAREAVNRLKARGGNYASLGARREGGSLAASAFRFQGLDAWGRSYADQAFDPFDGSALIDQAISGSADPYVSSISPGETEVEPVANSVAQAALLQGLLLAPELLTRPTIGHTLLRRPFVEASLGGGFVQTDDDWGWTSEAEVQSFATAPFPWSFYGGVRVRDSESTRTYVAPGTVVPFSEFDLRFRPLNGYAYLTARPTPADTFVSFIDARSEKETFSDAVTLIDIPSIIVDATTYNKDVDRNFVSTGAAWSHTFGFRNVLKAGVFGTYLTEDTGEETHYYLIPFDLGTISLDATTEQTTYLAAINHSLGINDMTVSYGLEGGLFDQTRTERTVTDLLLSPPKTTTVATSEADLRFGRAYLDAAYDITQNLKVEAGAFGTLLSGTLDTGFFEPRAGFAVSPLNGHWLRAGYIRESVIPTTITLAPLGVAGLQANAAPLDIGGYADTFAARWDAEWTPWFFTSLNYQHQDLKTLSIPVPASTIPIDSSLGFEDGTIDRLSAAANLHLGHGFGAFATAAYAPSKNTTPGTAYGIALPFVPEVSGRFGLTYVHPWNIKATLAATYVGTRVGDSTGTELDPYWTVDAALAFEPLDKRLSFELGAFNLLDEEFEVATNTAGWGRTFTGVFKVRF